MEVPIEQCRRSVDKTKGMLIFIYYLTLPMLTGIGALIDDDDDDGDDDEKAKTASTYLTATSKRG